MDVVHLHFPISEATPVYGGFNPVKINPASCMGEGATSNSLKLELHNHIGTHVDCPRHFTVDGATLDDYSAAEWIFSNVCLIDVPCEAGQIVGPDDVSSSLTTEHDALLIRTGFESKRQEQIYWENNPGFSPDLGKYLRKNFPKLKLIGFDSISLTSFSNRELGREAHRAFLSSEFEGTPIRILEDMRLSPLTKAPQKLIVSPLPIESGDGAPCSVFAEL